MPKGGAFAIVAFLCEIGVRNSDVAVVAIGSVGEFYGGK
jgi:hypothetical protein